MLHRDLSRGNETADKGGDVTVRTNPPRNSGAHSEATSGSGDADDDVAAAAASPATLTDWMRERARKALEGRSDGE